MPPAVWFILRFSAISKPVNSLRTILFCAFGSELRFGKGSCLWASVASGMRNVWRKKVIGLKTVEKSTCMVLADWKCCWNSKCKFLKNLWHASNLDVWPERCLYVYEDFSSFLFVYPVNVRKCLRSILRNAIIMLILFLFYGEFLLLFIFLCFNFRS